LVDKRQIPVYSCAIEQSFGLSMHTQEQRTVAGAPVGAVLVTLAALAACANQTTPHQTTPNQIIASPHSELHGRTLQALRSELDAGSMTSVSLVRKYLDRIAALDHAGPTIRSVLVLNPDALAQAKALDVERKQGRVRGPLHGMPILIKDNIESTDPMPTTAGSLALADNRTGRDAPIVANLRAAGAVILGKTNLSEWANFRSSDSISGWSAIGGLTKNPHVLDRSPCGSSAGSGAAIAAGLAAASIGTETDGSIVCPASMNGVVGLKPTLGLLSGRRIVPIAHSQDTAGPMAISVYDVAVVLDAMVGKQPACEPPARECKRSDYVAGLSNDALRGKRIGVLRFKPSRQPQIEPIYDRALQVIRAAGAELVDVETPQMEPIDEAEELVLHAEFKVDLNAYLATLPAPIQTRTLEALIAFNAASRRELVLFGQETFVKANATPDDQKYRDALALSKRLAGEEGIGRLLREHKLDLLVAPTTGTSWRIDIASGDQFPGSFSTLPAVAGYPHLTVPMGKLHQLPIGISFIGAPWTEDKLLAAGYAFEQRANVDVKAKFLPSIEEGNPAFVGGE
jgi:amidase